MTVPVEPTQPVSADMLPQQPTQPSPQTFVQGGYGISPQRFGNPGEVRSPGLVLLLTYVTLGFYGFYAHYKINKEMKEFTSTVNVSPGLATFALFVPIAGLVTAIATSGRIKQVQTSIGLRADASGFVTFLCMIVGANWAYQQSKLNGVWKHPAAQNAPR